MSLKQSILAAGLLGFAACSNYDQDSARTDESTERPTFGSATDIASASEQAARQTNAASMADNGLGGPVQRESGNYQAQPLPGQMSDQELEKMILVALTTGSMGTTGVLYEDQLTRKINVRAQNGVVTLTGAVSNENEKRIIEKQVLGMQGVREVRNNLTTGGRTLEGKPLESLVPRDPSE